jgi:hypothetical protein
MKDVLNYEVTRKKKNEKQINSFGCSNHYNKVTQDLQFRW